MDEAGAATRAAATSRHGKILDGKPFAAVVSGRYGTGNIKTVREWGMSNGGR